LCLAIKHWPIANHPRGVGLSQPCYLHKESCREVREALTEKCYGTLTSVGRIATTRISREATTT
jgi:hypothetical protein